MTVLEFKKINKMVTYMKIDQKIKLAFLPTPIESLTRINNLLSGPKLFIKRDDNTGLAFGGNKTRKLEYLAYDALQKGADTLVSSGAIQSNHCRQVAATAAKLGLNCELLLKGEQPKELTGNLFLNKLLGAKIHWTNHDISTNALTTLAEQLKLDNKKPYVIPVGGSDPIGSLGYVNAMIELTQQIKNTTLKFDHIVFASCSGGTHAGLAVGAKLMEFNGLIHGIQIAELDFLMSPYEKHLADLSNMTTKLIALNYNFERTDFIVNKNYLGQGYGIVTDNEKRAIDFMAKQEGILLDPVYSARAFGGLLDMIDKKVFNKNENILFWHTGGQPALFAHTNLELLI